MRQEHECFVHNYMIMLELASKLLCHFHIKLGRAV